jgi:fused signal recognition particle receptor
VRAGVLAEEEGDIDGGPQPEEVAPGPVDQLMRGGMGDLAEPEGRSEVEQDTLAGRKAAVTGDGPDDHRQGGKFAEGDRHEKKVGRRKLGTVGRAGGKGDELVENDGQKPHVKEGRPEPQTAMQDAHRKQGQRQEGCQRKAGKRDRTEGSRGMAHAGKLSCPADAARPENAAGSGHRSFIVGPKRLDAMPERGVRQGARRAMSFFKKLKDRLFRSSDKIGDGLEALVGDGEAADAAPEVSVAPRVVAGNGTDALTAAAPVPAPEPRTAPVPSPAPKPEPEAARPGLLGRILGTAAPDEARRVLDDAMLESLEELLIQADMGVETAVRVTANIAEGRFGRKVSASDLRTALAAEVTRIMDPVARPMPLYPTKPQVVLVVGVNGSGKTTTIGKLASQFKAAGKSVVIAAGDTFRAAAVEQLQIWGQRAGVPVLTAPEGSDPASLAFDALTKAKADGADLLMIDTAGRLQNRADLMEELAKIVRVIRKVDPTAPHNTLLVLDATTGQNALMQVEIFRKIADVSGLVMTKLDGTAKGGVLVALADKFGLPIHAIGVGEQIDDLAPFDPEEFARALVGIDG